MPKPLDRGLPVDPSLEWTKVQQGEEVHTNPMGHDDLHLVEHFEAMEIARKEQQPDQNATEKLSAHLAEQQIQRRMKVMTAAHSLTEQHAPETRRRQRAGGLHARPAVPMGVQNLQAALGGMMAPQPGLRVAPGVGDQLAG